ncbi:DUF1906 domain-containing protein [Streptomyces sp. LP05-1]|uniref:DUF1906 domain-containing protein n=1 Tax=Streptomyces pyxinae TaxID=2970734 RepID=A0ABT2CLN8_9ACTN|nr:DUF1906 domain-containing protein [Streptomyces sp. LP05-1]MCS0638330.1 DUF1906 domain-containing protein [Streptomyces sp. LP05-1]
MAKHRMTRRGRLLVWTGAGAVLAGGGAFTASALSPATVTRAAAKVAQKQRPAPAVFTGHLFDTCTAPSLSAMKAWKGAGAYGGVAVYIGGRNRGCAQPELTPSWVKSVSASGWKVAPLYVGLQPPCQKSGSKHRIDPARATEQGTADGADVVARAAALGMRPGSALYFDMEPYDIKDTACDSAVLGYVRAWNRAVRAKGYWAGYYGFASTSAAAVATATARNPADMPDAFWYALWNGQRTTTADWPWQPSLWTGHRRAHQYLANSKETHGGVTLTVDRDDWDAPVAVVTP